MFIFSLHRWWLHHFPGGDGGMGGGEGRWPFPSGRAVPGDTGKTWVGSCSPCPQPQAALSPCPLIPCPLLNLSPCPCPRVPCDCRMPTCPHNPPVSASPVCSLSATLCPHTHVPCLCPSKSAPCTTNPASPTPVPQHPCPQCPCPLLVSIPMSA